MWSAYEERKSDEADQLALTAFYLISPYTRDITVEMVRPGFGWVLKKKKGKK